MGFFETIIVLIVCSVAIYGINCFGEKYQGKEITSEAEDILNELTSYFIRLCPLMPKKEKNVIRNIKPILIEKALRIALEDYKKNGKSSQIGIWMATRSEGIKNALKKNI